MDLIPSVVYQGAAVSLETDQPEATMEVVVGILNKENDTRLPNISLVQSVAETTKWQGTLSVPNTFPLGESQWQLWVDSIHKDSGTFFIVEGLDGTITKSPNELRLEAVQKSIDNLMKTGISGFTISGDYTTRIALPHLKSERWNLQNLVNIERKAKGLPPLPGSQPVNSSYTFMG